MNNKKINDMQLPASHVGLQRFYNHPYNLHLHYTPCHPVHISLTHEDLSSIPSMLPQELDEGLSLTDR